MSPEFALRLPRPDPGKWTAGALAVLVHILLASLLIFGVQWQTQPEATTVEVELYRAAPAPAAVQPQPRPEAEARPPEPKPVPKLEPRPVPKVAPAPAHVKPDIALKEKHPPKVEPKAQPKPEPKPLAKPEPRPAPRTPQQDYSKELAAADQSVANTRASLAADKELSTLKAAQAAAARSKASKNWQERIAAKVKGNIVLPPGLTGNPQADFDITLMTNGDVLLVKLHKSSGNRALDDAIERAIYKSSPLPLPENRDVFQRELRPTFSPLKDQ